MKIYILLREGVYRHEIVAVARTLETAHRTARAAIERERDDYHDIALYEAEVGRSRTLALPPLTDRYTVVSRIEDAARYVGRYQREDGPKIGTRITYREAKP